MNNISDIYNAINYIENHIKEPINIGDLADKTGYSKYHFSRLFKDITGYKPSDYLRGRKISEALLYMQTHHTRIIDAAFEFGFTSPEVFTRACLSAFGQSPSQIKTALNKGSFIGIPPIEKHQLLQYHQYKTLTVTKEELPSLLLKGYTYTSGNFLETLDLTNPYLKPLIKTSTTYYHLHWVDNKPKTYHHLIGVPVHIQDISDDDFNNYVYKKLPKGMFLSFPIGNEKELTTMDKYVYDYFLPRNEYIQQRNFAVEVIKPCGDQHLRSSLLYVPVKPRKKPRR